MIPIPAWAVMKSIITPQRIIMLVGAIAVAIILWNIKSTYSERDKLKTENATQQVTIQDLTDAVKTKTDIINELQRRTKEIKDVEDKREVKVEVAKSKSKTFVEKSKQEVEVIKKETPNLLAEHYETKYNQILQCIEDTTKLKETSC